MLLTTCAQVEKLVEPNAAAVDAVNVWLKQNSLNGTALSPTGDWVGFEIPAGKANTLFNANFSVFEHGTSGKQAIRTMLYSLPPSLQGHVDLVHPTTSCVSFISRFKYCGNFCMQIPSPRREGRDRWHQAFCGARPTRQAESDRRLHR